MLAFTQVEEVTAYNKSVCHFFKAGPKYSNESEMFFMKTTGDLEKKGLSTYFSGFNGIPVNIISYPQHQLHTQQVNRVWGAPSGILTYYG